MCPGTPPLSHCILATEVMIMIIWLLLDSRECYLSDLRLLWPHSYRPECCLALVNGHLRSGIIFHYNRERWNTSNVLCDQWLCPNIIGSSLLDGDYSKDLHKGYNVLCGSMKTRSLPAHSRTWLQVFSVNWAVHLSSVYTVKYIGGKQKLTWEKNGFIYVALTQASI